MNAKRPEITLMEISKEPSTFETFQDLIFVDCLLYLINENHFHFFLLHTSARMM